jgi:SagB-type dehydrogenase family enzyme
MHVSSKKWQNLLLSPGDAEQIWELFHENSKIGRHSFGLSDQQAWERLSRFHESLPFSGYPVVRLPRKLEPITQSLARAITTRASVHDMTPKTLTIRRLATILSYAYGTKREGQSPASTRQLRVVPSAGALYPLEVFVYSEHVKRLAAGLYHYNPVKNQLRRLRRGNEISKIAQAIVQSDVAYGASLLVFITAVFERSVFKYGDRGYRFVLLEAGHVAQNINLVAGAMGLGCLNIGGFYDREIDEYLDLDGVTHSTIYLVAVGRDEKANGPVDEKGRKDAP